MRDGGALQRDNVTGEPSVVLIVDDDASVLRSLRRLIGAAGLEVRAFAGPRQLVAAEIPRTNACLVLDVNLPEINGVELLERLADSGRSLPAMMITLRSDARTQSLLIRSHAAAILFKPVVTPLKRALC